MLIRGVTSGGHLIAITGAILVGVSIVRISAPDLLLQVGEAVPVIVALDVVLCLGIQAEGPLKSIDQEITVDIGVVGVETNVSDPMNIVDYGKCPD